MRLLPGANILEGMELRSAEAIFRALNESGVRYLVVGGLAVNAHGYERMTKDIDLVIQLEPANVLRAWTAIEAAGYRPKVPVTAEQFADLETREGWRREKMMLVLQFWSDEHRRTTLDVFVHEPFDFDREYREASRQELDSGLTIPIIRIPTLLEMKRAAGRSQDLVDIEKLLKLEELRGDG